MEPAHLEIVPHVRVAFGANLGRAKKSFRVRAMLEKQNDTLLATVESGPMKSSEVVLPGELKTGWTLQQKRI